MDQPTTTSPRRRRTARDAIVLVLVAAALLVLLQGPAIRDADDKMRPGVLRDVVHVVGVPAGAIGDALPFADAADAMVGWLSPDEDLSSDGGFSVAASSTGGARVSPEAFAGSALEGAAKPRPLKSLLVTGDSMSIPLDVTLARTLTAAGVKTTRDPHVGTGISKTGLIDWGRLAGEQARKRPDAVVMFIGANEGFPMKAGAKEVPCCGAAWAAEYATRVRGMLDAYGVGAGTRVYWITLPTPRQDELREVTEVVNQSVRVATAGYGSSVRLVDAEALLTPGRRFRSAIELGDRERIVRDADGVHLNELGAEVLGARVLDALRRDFVVEGLTR